MYAHTLGKFAKKNSTKNWAKSSQISLNLTSFIATYAQFARYAKRYAHDFHANYMQNLAKSYAQLRNLT